MNGSEPKYSCSFIIPKSDAETIGKIQAAIEEAKQSGVTKWGHARRQDSGRQSRGRWQLARQRSRRT